ncbi:MAG: glycosyltransferase family 9 protein [Asticcacaulis sp.]
MKAAFPILILALCEPAKTLSISGVIRRLKAEVPHAHVTLVTGKLSHELYQDDDCIDERKVFDGRWLSLDGVKLAWTLYRQKWGLVVDIGPSWLSPYLQSKTRFIRDRTNPAGPLAQIRHKLQLEGEAGPDLRISPAREAGVRTFLNETRDDGRPTIVIAPGASWIGKRWPTERLTVLATRLMRDDGPYPGAKLLIIGSQADHDSAVALRMATPRAQVMELTGKLDLLSAYAAIRHGDVFIGNDDVWLHLAAAGGVESFGLFGPTPDADAPEGDAERDNVHIVRGPRSFDEIHETDPKLKQSVCHMLDLSIDTVYESIRAVADSRKTGETEAEPEREPADAL